MEGARGMIIYILFPLHNPRIACIHLTDICLYPHIFVGLTANNRSIGRKKDKTIEKQPLCFVVIM